MTNDRLPISEIWVYLSGNPLFALVLTLAAYQFAYIQYVKSNRHPIVNPVGVTVLIVAVGITLIDMPYKQYFEGAQFIHFLLGTATVALAVPIYRGCNDLKGKLFPITLALIIGSIVSVSSAVLIASALGAGDNIVGSMLAKSVTAPIAMGIAERIHVSPTLTAVFAVATGMIGSILAPYIMNALKIKPWWMRGTAIGVGAHGLGITRAFSINDEAGMYASMAMGMNGVLSAIALPTILGYMRG